MSAPFDPDYDPQAAKDAVLCFAAEVERISQQFHLPVMVIAGLPKQQESVFYYAGISVDANRREMRETFEVALKAAADHEREEHR